MKFLELNKKRHATKHFTDKPVDPKAEKKMKRKRLDLIVANDISAKDRGMGADDNAATILFADGSRKEIPLMKKDALAAEVIEAIAGKLR